MTGSALFFRSLVPKDWRGRPSFDKAADFAVVLAVLSLPWSTTLAAIFLVAWILLLAPTVDLGQFVELFKLPQCYLPILLFALAVLGLSWSEASWSVGLYAVGTVVKLLALPLLIVTFGRSERGAWVFVAFLISCVLLEALSWMSWLNPKSILDPTKNAGVPVKNYISQSQEFVLAMFGCTLASIMAWRAGRRLSAFFLCLLAISFPVNMFFVISSRTALVSLPILLLILAARYLNPLRLSILVFVLLAVSATIWVGSSSVHERLESIVSEVARYRSTGEPTSAGQRLEFWKKSIEFVREAPLLGHGTGSIKELFREDAVGKEMASAVVIANPHNQTFDFAIQWGIVGVILMYAMWISYVRLFWAEGWVPWVGLLVVLQNVSGSIFNSHISDFVEGWIFVIGVGTAAGMMLERSSRRETRPNVAESLR